MLAEGGMLVMKSLLVGNGLDIQLGGNDFLNKWIIVRLLADAKSGKFDDLFKNAVNSSPAITGDELVLLFMEMTTLGNKARNGEYDLLIDETAESEMFLALMDFKNKYNWEIKSPEQIGLEDWLLLLRLFVQEHLDLLPIYSLVKQGFERVVLDSIYCDGAIQNLHKNVNKKAKEFFGGFDKLFTLNYDNSLEKIVKKSVFHLHGDFGTIALSENLKTAYGFLRKKKGETIIFPSKFSHCNCNAILDYSGDNKYKLAVTLSSAIAEFNKLKSLYESNRAEFESFLLKFPVEQQEIIIVGMEENLPFGYNYHFHELEQLTGELTIIGIAPQNDNHLFDCINRSNLEKVVFYYLSSEGDNSPILPISKPYETKDVTKLWASIQLQSPKYSSSTAQDFHFKMLKNKAKAQEIVNLFNKFETNNVISASDILKQLKSIPKNTEKSIIRMMTIEMQKEKYHVSPQSAEEHGKLFRDFGRTLMTSSLSPQALYFLYFSNLSKSTKGR